MVNFRYSSRQIFVAHKFPCVLISLFEDLHENITLTKISMYTVYGVYIYVQVATCILYYNTYTVCITCVAGQESIMRVR